MRRHWLRAAVIVVLFGGFAGAYVLGRQTAPVHDRGWANGQAVGYANGVADGRALQLGDTVAPGDKDAADKAFKVGYRAGQIDSFGSYDGGWSIGHPYFVVLAHGEAGATYRIAQREPLIAGTTYVLCSSGAAVCHQ